MQIKINSIVFDLMYFTLKGNEICQWRIWRFPMNLHLRNSWDKYEIIDCADTFGKKYGRRGTCRIMRTRRVPEILNPALRASLPPSSSLWMLLCSSFRRYHPPLEIRERTELAGLLMIPYDVPLIDSDFITRAPCFDFGLWVERVAANGSREREKLRIDSPHPTRVFSATLKGIFGNQSAVPVAIKRG